jgi:hypothetical protein
MRASWWTAPLSARAPKEVDLGYIVFPARLSGVTDRRVLSISDGLQTCAVEGDV